MVAGWDPDYVITLGDNNYGADSDIDDNIGQFYSAFIGNYQGSYGSGSPVNRFWPSLGNNEGSGGTVSCNSNSCSGAYFDYFTLPGNERYYEVDYGLVGLFVLNSNTGEPDGINDSSAQAQWLQQELSASTACFNIVYFHHPPYSSSSGATRPAMRWPFTQWGADVVMAGHIHSYERLEVDGIPYFVNGVGGKNGAMLVTATENGITYQYFKVPGQLNDELFVPKSC